MGRTQPAVEGGQPVRGVFLPFARPSIGDGEIEEVVETLRSGWLTVGPRTKAFEQAIAEYVGVERAAALSSCTAGLHLGMIALGVEPGDEVILPALNFAAGPNSAIHLGARPVLVDVDPSTLNVTPEIVEAAITERTRVVVPLHFGGRPCDIDGLMDLARQKGVRVLGDGAHAMSSDYGERKVGSVADATAFSFYVTKGITTGEGGCLTSPDAELVDRVSVLSLHGMSSGAWNRYSERGTWFYEIDEPGYKYNMGDVQAALGLRQMERVDDFRHRRKAIADAYTGELGASGVVTVPGPSEGGTHAWHLYPITLDTDALRIGRDDFIRALKQEGVGTSVHFIPIHYHAYYERLLGHARGSFPVTEDYFERAVSLPIYPSMTDEDVTDVIEAVAKLSKFYKR
jgi:dTDP-4-amino-4,6-dideoxygalactose transaminase